ncbi:MAG: ATP-grasp domain-containing protein [Candidatus Kapaibacteriota bacterium]
MKKIGIFCGADISFPMSLIDYISSKSSEVLAEIVKIGVHRIDTRLQYDLILDRISRDVPMYQSILKTLVMNGIIVINNPFMKCLEDYFFQLSVAKELGLKVPETAIIPTKQHPVGTTSETFKNLIYPLNWSELFDYIGFPMFIRLNTLNSENLTYKVYNPMEFFSAYDNSGSRQLVVQKAYDYSSYYRAFVIGRKIVKVFNYDITKPPVSRYSKESSALTPSHKKEIESIATKICEKLSLDFNTIDFGVCDNKILVLNFYNTAPKIDTVIFDSDTYQWFVFTTGDFLLSILENPKDYIRNSQWYNFFKK